MGFVCLVFAAVGFGKRRQVSSGTPCRECPGDLFLNEIIAAYGVFVWSESCSSALGRSPRPLAIDFLGLSGSWAPDPLQTLPQTVFAEGPFHKHPEVLVHLRRRNTGAEPYKS